MNSKPKIGFISPPAWFDPAPSEFPTVVEECVLTQQAPLLLPEFDYRLETIANTQNELNLCARSIKAIGCDLIAQVGSPFAWACVQSEAEARYRNESIINAAEIPALMVLSLLTFIIYALDKSAAKNGAWRAEESTLHLLSLAGGWPGALIAQQKLRHKSKKQSFRSVFWVTVLLNCGAFAWSGQYGYPHRQYELYPRSHFVGSAWNGTLYPAQVCGSCGGRLLNLITDSRLETLKAWA